MDKRKKSVIAVLFLSILSSLAESVSIALLVPFVSFFVNPDDYIFNSFLSWACIWIVFKCLDSPTALGNFIS